MDPFHSLLETREDSGKDLMGTSAALLLQASRFALDRMYRYVNGICMEDEILHRLQRRKSAAMKASKVAIVNRADGVFLVATLIIGLLIIDPYEDGFASSLYRHLRLYCPTDLSDGFQYPWFDSFKFAGSIPHLPAVPSSRGGL